MQTFRSLRGCAFGLYALGYGAAGLDVVSWLALGDASFRNFFVAGAALLAGHGAWHAGVQLERLEAEIAALREGRVKRPG